MTAVITSTKTKGTMVVNQDREETSGINYEKNLHKRLCFNPSFKLDLKKNSKQKRLSYLKYQQHNKVSIRHPLELLKQVDGQEGEDVVL